MTVKKRRVVKKKAVRKAVAKPKVLIYTTPTCPYCHMAKAFLKEHKVAYKDINVAANPAKANEMVEKSGQMGVPVLDINGTIIVGFDEARFRKALGL